MAEVKSDDPRIIKIGQNLRKLRKAKGHGSYVDFANSYGLDKSQYWRLEAGIGFNVKSLLRILDIHQISLKDFFNDFEEVYPYENPLDSN